MLINAPEGWETTLSDEQIGVKGGVKELTDIQKAVLLEMRENPIVTTGELAQKLDVRFRTLQRYISQLREMGVLIRVGGRKEGKWVVKVGMTQND